MKIELVPGAFMPEHVLSLSYGKDSLACLGAIEQLGWPLDRIVHAEVWATDTIPADLPPMVEFKAKADRIIKSGGALRWSTFALCKTVKNLHTKKCFTGAENRAATEIQCKKCTAGRFRKALGAMTD